MSAVYVISAGPMTHKIGVSANPSARMMDLQAGNHEPLTLVAEIEHHAPFVIERAAHAALAHRRLMGEWFSCYASCAMHAINTAIEETPAPVSQQRPTDDAAKPSLRDSQARREQPATAPRSRDGGPPKRDRAAYMRQYRAEHPKERK